MAKSPVGFGMPSLIFISYPPKIFISITYPSFMAGRIFIPNAGTPAHLDMFSNPSPSTMANWVITITGIITLHSLQVRAIYFINSYKFNYKSNFNFTIYNVTK